MWNGRGRAAAGWVAVGLVLMLMLPIATACARAATPRVDRAHVHVIAAINGFSAHALPDFELERQLAAIHAQGVEVVRSDAPWANVEPNPPGPNGPQWQFSFLDRWVAALASHQLRWEPLVDFSVWWAKTCPNFCPPASNDTYATFAQAIAARYGAHGGFWSQHPGLPYLPAQVFEIWNEENTSTFWSTGPNPAQYAALYLAARKAIRAVDGSASVIVGGLTTSGMSYDPHHDLVGRFVKRMFAAVPALRGHVDGFGLHPYATSAEDVVAWVARFRQVLDSLGESSAPIDITELGWPTGDATAETARASGMRYLALELAHSNCGIRLLAPYDWINPLTAGEPGDFGFVDRTGLGTTLRPAGVGWFQGLAQARTKHEVLLCTAPTRTGL